MKKHLSFLLVFSFIFLLFGCQSANKHYIDENGNETEIKASYVTDQFDFNTEKKKNLLLL